MSIEELVRNSDFIEHDAFTNTMLVKKEGKFYRIENIDIINYSKMLDIRYAELREMIKSNRKESEKAKMEKERHNKIIEMALAGKTKQEIMSELKISHHTVWRVTAGMNLFKRNNYREVAPKVKECYERGMSLQETMDLLEIVHGVIIRCENVLNIKFERYAKRRKK